MIDGRCFFHSFPEFLGVLPFLFGGWAQVGCDFLWAWVFPEIPQFTQTSWLHSVKEEKSSWQKHGSHGAA